VSVATGGEQPALRIGELSRRLGVSPHVLRAWERRYGLLHPVRSGGGFRLYSAADEQRVRAMQFHLARGLAAAEAARAALAQETPAAAGESRRTPSADGLSEGGAALQAALDGLDEPAAQQALDRLLAQFTVESVLRDVVLPYLRDLGERWQQGSVDVGHEHFASNVLRSRLASLARGWGLGHGSRAVLACPPGERHDLALLAFGLVLNRRGWRIAYLGADTPLDDLIRMARDTEPAAVVLAATTAERFSGVEAELSQLARIAPLFVAGAGASPELARATGSRLLQGDPVTEAGRLANGARG
jgi:MerR family transcriptional regulator, light-induced transcriptional regulator